MCSQTESQVLDPFVVVAKDDLMRRSGRGSALGSAGEARGRWPPRSPRGRSGQTAAQRAAERALCAREAAAPLTLAHGRAIAGSRTYLRRMLCVAACVSESNVGFSRDLSLVGVQHVTGERRQMPRWSIANDRHGGTTPSTIDDRVRVREAAGSTLETRLGL